MFGKMVAVADATPVAEFAPMEIAAALTWTRQAAATQLDLAMDIVRRLPDVHAAMARGDVDLPKVRVIRDGVAGLRLGLARRIAAAILPDAPDLTTGQLRARLAKLVIEADPEAALHRHKARVRQRRMVVQPTEDGCANVLGLDLPAGAAMAAVDRVAAIARAIKRAGDPRSLDQLRADTFLDLLLGNATAEPGRLNGGVELVGSLETLAGLVDNPGHLNGYGPVIADIVRQVAEQSRHAPWSFTIYDNATGDLFTGTTRVRPTPDPESEPKPEPTSSASRPRSAKHRNAFRDVTASGAFGDPNRRFPNAALARHVRARDRSCRAPGCRRSAMRADLDHTIAFQLGGRTTAGNLGPLCRFHHRAKHEGGWRLFQIRPGIFIWLSPLGKLYLVTPEPP
jgi:hypothetical protein